MVYCDSSWLAVLLIMNTKYLMKLQVIIYNAMTAIDNTPNDDDEETLTSDILEGLDAMIVRIQKELCK